MKSHVPVSAEIPPELKPMMTPHPIMKRFPRVLCRISATLYATFLMASGISEAAAPSSFRPGEIWPDNTPEAWKKPLASAELESLDGYDKVLFRDFTGGQMARDMTLFADDDGTAYHIYSSEENGTLQISLLTDDYLKPACRYDRVLPGGVNEAQALFKHQGKYYMIRSGCTGWAPNAARLAVADHIGGPWTELGNPCVGPADRVNITFEGQSTHVIPVTGRPGAFILMADRWRPGNAIDGRHLWYPFVVGTDGKVRIEEHDAWDLSVFDLKPFDAKRAPRITPNANGDAAKPDTADWADARLLAETTK